MSYRLLLLASLLAWMAPQVSAHAQMPRASLRVQVRTSGPMDARLFERLRGQTSDLPVELERYKARAALGSFANAVTQAFDRCRESGADVVVWSLAGQRDAQGGAAAWIVALATCADSRVLARRIEPGRPARGARASSPSGALETAALVLRGALQVLAQGGTLGVLAAEARGPEEAGAARALEQVSTGEAASQAGSPLGEVPSTDQSASAPPPTGSEPAPATRARSAAPAVLPSAAAAASKTSSVTSTSRARSTEREVESTPSPSTARAPRSKLALLASVGWQQSWDSAHPSGRPALQAALALGRERFRLGIAGSFGFPTQQRDAFTELTLARHSVVAQWRQLLWQDPDWSVSAGLDAGSALYWRETRSQNSAARARPAALSGAALLGTWCSIGRRLGPLWIALFAGLDVLPAPPQFLYQIDVAGQTFSRDVVQLWPVAPRVGLSLGAGRP